MTLSSDQAAENLKQIDRTRQRSAEAYRYAHASPFFVMWGAIWVAGYGSSDLYPRYAGTIWIALTVAGSLGSAAIGQYYARAGRRHRGSINRVNWRFLASFLTIGSFVMASFALFGHTGWRQQAAFVPLVIAMFYTLVGLWAGLRFVITGIAVAALTLGGFFFLPAHFLLWMAAVGGGALVLAGQWMKKI